MRGNQPRFKRSSMNSKAELPDPLRYHIDETNAETDSQRDGHAASAE